MSPQALKEIVEHLSSFPTRNSLSPYLRPAMEWVADQYRAIPGMEVELMEFILPVGPRVPEPTPVVQVIATLRGERSDLVMQSAHVDSLCLGVNPVDGRAPGANDDASGVAVGICVARSLAHQKPKNSLKFVATCGEEQGLLGAKALAARAKEEHWPILGILNNDMVGSSRNLNNQSEPHALRLYSDLPARELARYAEWVVRQTSSDFKLKMHLRPDRFGRGGDHTPFANLGFPAVRLTEVHEEWAHQHTSEDTVENMDFEFLARSAEANRVVMDQLSKSGPAPTNVTFDPKAGYHTNLSWQGEPQAYQVFWRETSSATWQGCQRVTGQGAEMKNLNKDEFIFGVAAEHGVPVEAHVAT